ncbi:MAG TPA: hypothetical protein VF530_08335 [Planctomycetota bacterium]
MKRAQRPLPYLLAMALAGAAPTAQDCFSSSGGPGGDFDWVVRTGEIFFFDTTATTVQGGPNGVPTISQLALGGRIEVRNLVIEPGGEIRVQGPNPMRIQASGDVIVRGLLDVSGFSARNVATLNTGNQIEQGGAGVAGGGRGGVGNPNTDRPSPRGGTGSGPFGASGGGAQGGEGGWAPGNLGKDARRPGGGGGARFAADRAGEVAATGFSLVASAGSDGHPSSTGAETGLQPARGGVPNAGVFADGKAENDFFGVGAIAGPGGRVLGLVRGELPDLWAGYGGGGGGNAMQSFPNPSWNFGSDEKGGGGGGGGGALHVQALGRIVFGEQGQIRSNGANGGTGENTNFLDHVGGTGGSGSGGHVVLESALEVDFSDGGANSGVRQDWITAYGMARRTGPTADVNACCRTYSNGGAGGPGVLQLHVPNPLLPPGANPARTDIVVPAAIAQRRDPLDRVSSPRAYPLFLTCTPSVPLRWLGLGGAAGPTRFLPVLLDAQEGADPAAELVRLELPRRF